MIRLPVYEEPKPIRRKPRMNFESEDDFVSESLPLLPPYDASSGSPLGQARFIVKQHSESPRHPIITITAL